MRSALDDFLFADHDAALLRVCAIMERRPFMAADLDLKELRHRAALYLSDEVASVAHMRLDQLQQFVAGAFHPSTDQLIRLARRIGMAS